MATFDYARSRATAERLLKKFGQTGAIRRTTMTGPDWDPTPSTDDYDATVVILDYAAREIDGSLIQAGDRRVLVSTEGLTMPALSDDPSSEDRPTVADSVVVGSMVFDIIRVDEINPGGTTIMFDLQARR